MPENACAIRSSPRSRASGPVWPNGEMRKMASRALPARSPSGESPDDSSRPGPRSSTIASADSTSFASHGSRVSASSSATTEYFPRFSDWK